MRDAPNLHYVTTFRTRKKMEALQVPNKINSELKSDSAAGWLIVQILQRQNNRIDTDTHNDSETTTTRDNCDKIMPQECRLLVSTYKDLMLKLRLRECKGFLNISNEFSLLSCMPR